MKSVVITFIIFAVVFALLHYNVLDFIGSTTFSFLSIGLFILVLGCGFIFVGVPHFNTNNTNNNTKTSKRKKTKRETKNEKN